jgi:hypothetical protein
LAATGKTLEQITDIWNVRQQAFSVAGNTKEDNKELNKQLGQMSSDGTGAASDANIINDRMPMLTQYVVREYMAEKGITDYNKGLGSYNKDLKGGKGVKYTWYDNALRNLVKDSGDSLERNRNSVATAQQRADNQVYLNTNNINSDAELSQVMKERIQAERELNEAMKPLSNTLAQLDIALTKLMTGSLRGLFGKNADGSDKTPEQKAQALGTAGGADGVISLPSQDIKAPTEQQLLDAHAKDPIHKLLKFMGLVDGDAQATADENRTRWSKVSAGASGDIWNQKEAPYNQAVTPGFLPTLELNLDEWQKRTPNTDDQKETPYRQTLMPGFLPQLAINMEKLQQTTDAFNRVQEAGKVSASQQPVGVLAPTTTITNAPVINIGETKFDIQVHGAATEQDGALVMAQFTQELDKQNAKIPQLVNDAMSTMIGNARSMQSQVRQ